MRMNVTRAAVLALLAASPAVASAQVGGGYEDRRQQIQKELRETLSRLAEIRSQRVTLQARVENIIASTMSQRAQTLLMSNEANALKQLDSLLFTAQDNLVAQRDRFRALGDAVRQQTGAVIVVLLRADSTSQAQSLTTLELAVDNASVLSRTYSTPANQALAVGAVDQVYRADVLPTTHSLRVTVNVNGQPVTQSVELNAQTQTTTYVQFAVRNGQVVASTWTARGTTPF